MNNGEKALHIVLRHGKPCGNSFFQPVFDGRVFSLRGSFASRRERGFTLMEIMVSLVLISLVAVSLIQLSSANLRNLSVSGNRIEALERANEKMREVLEGNLSEEKTWQDVDDEGYGYDMAIEEILKEKTEALPVKMMEITVWVKDTNEKGTKRVALNTVKMVARTDALADNKLVKKK